jgi:hypothetical protein
MNRLRVAERTTFEGSNRDSVARWDGSSVDDGRLAGSSLLLDIDEVLVGRAGAPQLFCGHDRDGQCWLVALIGEGLQSRRWLCAPATDVALGCVRSGRAAPADVFRHSSTGMVEVITVGADGQFSESMRLCADLIDDEVLSVPQFS